MKTFDVNDLSLYLVTDDRIPVGRDFHEIIESAIVGGVTMVQLREKEASTRAFYDKAVRLKKFLAPLNIPLIINDRLDIALAVDADGLHLGQSDLPYHVARRLMGGDKIIGISVENERDVIEANKLDVDYIGISPVFSTPTKTDTAPALNIEGATLLNKLSIHPSVGIGGIHLGNVSSVIQAGSEGVSVVSAIMMANDPKSAARQLKEVILKTKKNGQEEI